MSLLDPLEAAMLTADRWNPLNIGALLILRTSPDRRPTDPDSVFRDPLPQGNPVHPLLRRHPYRGVETAWAWAWRHVDAVDPERHVIRIAMPPRSDHAALWRLVGTLHAEPLETSRPMWRIYLIDGFDEHRVAVYVKAHHTLVDGMGGMQLITDMLSPRPDGLRPNAFRADDSDPQSTTSRGDILREHSPG